MDALSSHRHRIGRGRHRRNLSLWLACLIGLGLGLMALLSGGLASPGRPAEPAETSVALPWQLQTDLLAEPSSELAATLPASPEAALLQVFETLRQGRHRSALEQVGQLVQQHPNFQLAQLLHAELLGAGLQEPSDTYQASARRASASEANAQLEALASEARRRLLHPPLQQLQGRIPKGILQLGPTDRYVAAVDASASRLYWFANDVQPDGRQRLRLLLSTYASVGANGMGKFREGDARTPIGVYFVQRSLPGERLPDLYGVGALTLNYPNAIDLMRNKTGSGIWLHGTPSLQYARAPLATDGCVVLANHDMQTLLELQGTASTPVLIAERLEWVDENAASMPAGFERTLQDWLRHRLGGQPESLAGFYSPRFEREALGLDYWWPRLSRHYRNTRKVQALQLQSALAWRDEEDLIVATLAPPHRNGASDADVPRAERVRTYWRLEDGHWKIVYEGPA